MSLTDVIPPHLLDYCGGHSYFVTYYGEVYSGRLVECPGYDEGFFIVSINQEKDLKKLEKEKCTDPKEYKKIGWEIRASEILAKDSHNLDWIKKDPPGQEQIEKGRYNGVGSDSKDGREEWKKLFIFGAGASANCVADLGNGEETRFKEHPLAPPLGGKILDPRFRDYYRNFSQVERIVPKFNRSNKGVEEYFQDLWERIRHTYNPQLARSYLFTQFYLQELFRDISLEVFNEFNDVSLYGHFADEIQSYLNGQGNEVIGFVSFNYDTLLEDNLERAFEYPNNSIEEMVETERRRFLTFKPHGSWDMGWPLRKYHGRDELLERIRDKELEPRDLYFNSMEEMFDWIAADSWGYSKKTAPKVDEDDPKERTVGRFTLNKQLIERSRGDTPLLPSVLLPFKKKDDCMMPDSHHGRMEFFMDHVEELYIIGWHGNEPVFNRHFENELGRKLKRVVIANGRKEDCEKTANILAKRLKKGSGANPENIEWKYIEGFDQFVDQMEDILGNGPATA